MKDRGYIIQTRKENIVKNKPADCTECPSYTVCRNLCHDAELWISQDVVGSNSNVLLENGGHGGTSLSDMGGDFIDFISADSDVSIGDKDSETSQSAWGRVKEMRLTEKVTRFIYSYYMVGRRIRDIAINEGATSQAIDKRHQQAKASIKNRMDRAEAWVNMRDNIEYDSLRHYDMAAMFFGNFYPRRVISRVIGVHISTVIKYIGRQIRVD